MNFFISLIWGVVKNNLSKITVILSLFILIFYVVFLTNKLNSANELISKQDQVINKANAVNKVLSNQIENERQKTAELISFKEKERERVINDENSIRETLQKTNCGNELLPVDVVKRLRSEHY